MNPGGFGNNGGPRHPQQNGGMQRNGGASTDVVNHILNVLHSQPVPAGWQQTVPPKQRAGTIHQMVTGLRIVKPDMPLQYAISVATGFEMQQFTIAPDQDSYLQSIRQKLQEIHATRQNQANMHQQQLQNQQAAQMGLTPQQMQARGMMSGPPQFQPGFGVPQPSQPAQALGVPMQQQLSQNQQLLRQNGHPAEMQQPTQSNQPLQNMPRPGPPNRGQPQLSPEEVQQINNTTRQTLARLSDQERIGIHRRLTTTIPAAQQQAMQAQNIDPIAAYIRSQASQAFINERQKRLQMNGQGFPPATNGAMSAQGRPMSQVSIRGQPQPQPPPAVQQQPDSSFGVGNLDQFAGQQQEGFLRQAAGQDVVPASVGQPGPPSMRGTPQQPPQGQFAPNRPMQPPTFQPQPTPQWPGPQNQQPNVQQAGQMPMQPPTTSFPNMQNQTPQQQAQQALQGQAGGLGNNRGQRTPQQNPNMPMLNRPMDPPRNDQTQRPSQATPKPGQRNGQNGQLPTANNAQTNSAQPFWAKLPPHIQRQLQQLPEEQRKKWLMNMSQKQQQKNKAMAEAQKSGNTQDPQLGPQGLANGKKTTQVNSSQQANNAQAPLAGNPAMNPAGLQSGGNPLSRVNSTQQQGAQQGPPDLNRPAPPKMAPMPLSEAQVRFMDGQLFPPAILNKNNSLGQLPESVKTWRHLKEYVQQRAQSLPPLSMQNVVGLQSIHMQQIQAATVNKQQRAQQFQAVTQGNMQPGQTGQAPPAPPMVPPQQSQAPLPSSVSQGQFPLPQFPQLTAQELATIRATLPEHMKGIPDNHLRTMINQRRSQEFLKANQQRLNPEQQAMLQRNNMMLAQRMSAQRSQFPMGQGQPTQSQQAQREQGQPPQHAQQHPQPLQPPKQPTGPQGRQSQPVNQGQTSQPGQKAAQRPTNDDVIEVPDPKTQQQARPPNARPNQPYQMTGTQQMTPEAFARLSNEQKAQWQAKMREAHVAQRARMPAAGQAQASAAADNNHVGVNAGQQTHRDPALEGLMAEVARSIPQRPIVPMSPKTRSLMKEKLKDKTGSMVQRIEQSLPVFLQRSANVDHAKELLRMRLVLLSQVRDSKFDNPVDNFTMTIQELDQYKQKLQQYFLYMLSSVKPPPTADQLSGQPQQLSAKNLQQQQALMNAARVASAQQKGQANSSSRAPAAPTATHPPFSFKSQSPQGVPHYNDAGKSELTQDQLKLPQPKRRKPNQAASPASTPAQTINTPVTKSPPKIDSPDAQRVPMAPNMFKCAVFDCESGKTGFSTREELEKHHMAAHEPKEPAIKDPLDAAAYAIESLRIALNLDENGKSKAVAPKADQGFSKEEKGNLQAPTMKPSASSQSHNIKQEVATPMSRNPTQTGPSPSSNLLRTPQTTTNVKTPASDAKSAGKDVGAKGSIVKSMPTSAPDPWANSNVKPEWFKEVFSDAANINRAVPDDFITSWLERNPFTPPTSPSSGDKDSPHKSDISANDNLNINLAADDGDMLPSEWFDDALQGDMEALDVGDLMDMNWDTTLDAGEEEEMLGKGKRRRDPMEPSDEWMKAWAPEQYEEKLKKRDAQQRKR